MADRFRLDLKTFEISTDSFNVSLSMTSVAFIYNVPLRDITQEDLSSLIRSKQLWLLPRGLCRLDIRVQLDECDIIWREEQDGFFEFIADVICQSAVSQVSVNMNVISELTYFSYGCSLVLEWKF